MLHSLLLSTTAHSPISAHFPPTSSLAAVHSKAVLQASLPCLLIWVGGQWRREVCTELCEWAVVVRRQGRKHRKGCACRGGKRGEHVAPTGHLCGCSAELGQTAVCAYLYFADFQWNWHFPPLNSSPTYCILNDFRNPVRKMQWTGSLNNLYFHFPPFTILYFCHSSRSAGLSEG